MANYCRREIGPTRVCMGRITRANVLGWCEPCRERLPLWPTVAEAYEKHIEPEVQKAIEARL